MTQHAYGMGLQVCLYKADIYTLALSVFAFGSEADIAAPLRCPLIPYPDMPRVAFARSARAPMGGSEKTTLMVCVPRCQMTTAAAL